MLRVLRAHYFVSAWDLNAELSEFVFCGGLTLAGCQVHIKSAYCSPFQLAKGEKT